MNSPKILATHCSTDAVLHAIAPLGLAAAADTTCLVVDLDPVSPPLPGKRTLADLVEESPRRSDLHPDRTGVGVLPNGGVEFSQAQPILSELIQGWDRLVLRVPDSTTNWGCSVVPVHPLIPEFPCPPGPAVYQSMLPGSRLQGVGILLPPLNRSVIRSFLRGRIETRRRWIKTWQTVWGAPWE